MRVVRDDLGPGGLWIRSRSPVVVPVTGVVKLDGQPLADAKVTFLPKDKENASFTGTTDATGKFELTAANLRGASPARTR